MSNNLSKLKSDLKKLSNPEKAKNYQWFFKTGKGEYGEGDKFIGLTMPQIRSVIKNYTDLSLVDIQELLNSKIHEFRMAGVLILVKKYKQSTDNNQQSIIYKFYLKNTKNINNWDLVDLSAPNIVGEYLLDKDPSTSSGPDGRKILYKLAQSKNLWEKRIAIISTLIFIKNNQFDDTIKISKMLLNDKHDLIHKAVGWMLREVGKRDKKTLIKFLDKHAGQMPRVMLRYSIEKFEEKERKYYLNKK